MGGGGGQIEGEERREEKQRRGVKEVRMVDKKKGGMRGRRKGCEEGRG